MKIFETHAHLYMEDFDDDRDAIITQCFDAGIEYIINVAVDKDSFFKCKALAKQYKGLFYSVGFHPHDSEKFDEDFVCKHTPESIAIGEIGLDYYRNLSPKNIQKEVFEKQIEIALKHDKPMIIHDRDAHTDCYEILKGNNARRVVFHSFTGDKEFAKKVLDQGWFISFNGIVTFKNSRLFEVAKFVPLQKIFVETDSPYLSPHPKRGRRNSPLNLPIIINKLAEIKGVTADTISEKTFENAKKFFKLSDE